MITPEFFWGFAIAAAVASIFWIVFGSVKYAEVWNKNQDLIAAAKRDAATITHLKAAADPHAWLDEDDVAVNIAGREKMYDRHPELLKPGTEVIHLEPLDDVPPLEET